MIGYPGKPGLPGLPGVQVSLFYMLLMNLMFIDVKNGGPCQDFKMYVYKYQTRPNIFRPVPFEAWFYIIELKVPFKKCVTPISHFSEPLSPIECHMLFEFPLKLELDQVQ